MHYAIVEGHRRAASPGSRGECPHCGAPVLSKCGTRKVWHWSHLGKRHCDSWWEPETEWHRGWKAHFPVDWHEVAHRAPDGERHIADLKTPHGLVIEFQHSAIADDERTTRTDFYGNMVWVVDGMRRKRDRPRFEKETWDWRKSPGALQLLRDPDWALPYEWLDCRVPVFFDFEAKDTVAPDDPYYISPNLWCLLPKFSDESGLRSRLMLKIAVPDFISNAHMGHPVPDWTGILSRYEQQRKDDEAARIKGNIEYQKRRRQHLWARRNGLKW